MQKENLRNLIGQIYSGMSIALPFHSHLEAIELGKKLAEHNCKVKYKPGFIFEHDGNFIKGFIFEKEK